MTVVIFQITDERVAVLTDTLACDHRGEPAGFVDKIHLVPRLDLGICGSGSGDLLASWACFVHASPAQDLDAVNGSAPSALAALWESMGLHAEDGPTGGDRTTVYAFGWSKGMGAFEGYAYRSDRGFSSEKLPSGAVGVRPEPQFTDYDVSSLEEWIDLAVRLREQGIERRRRGEFASTIGGQLRLTVLSRGSVSSTEVLRFEEDYELLNGSALAVAS